MRRIAILVIAAAIGAGVFSLVAAQPTAAKRQGLGFRGTVSAVDLAGATVTVDTRFGALVLHRGPDSRIRKNGAPADIENLVIGDRANGNFRVVAGDKVIKELRARTPGARSIAGRLDSVDTGAGEIVLHTNGGRFGGSLTIRATGATIVRLGRFEAALGQLRLGGRIRVVAQRGGTSPLVADSIEQPLNGHDLDEVKGTVLAVGADTIDLELRDGSSFTLKVTDATIIVRDDSPASLGDLRPGDRVEAKYHVDGADNVADIVEVEVDEATDDDEDDSDLEVEGDVVSVGTNSLDVMTEDGDTITLLVDDATRITREHQPIALADLQPGDRVEAKYHLDGADNVADSVEVDGADDAHHDDSQDDDYSDHHDTDEDQDDGSLAEQR